MEYVIPVLLVPLFGPLLAITIALLYRVNHPGTRPVELESVRGERDTFWASLASARNDDAAVPLEEAILLNDRDTRRQAVLSTFRADSFKYLDVLMMARNDEDVDTTHYATIQITKIQRRFQLALQRYALRSEEEPHNLELLDAYIDLLGTYLDSSLPEKSLLRHQREVYAGLLDRRLALAGDDRGTLVKKLHNCTDIGEDYSCALEVIGQLKAKWPNDEQTWIETLRTFVEWKDAGQINETIQAMQTHKIRWTRWGREQVSSWVQ
jgi:hypothetical protein